MHSVYIVSPLPVIFGVVSLALGQWYLMGARFGVFLLIVIVYLLNRGGHARIATNAIFWGGILVFGAASSLVPEASTAAKTMGEIFVASTATGALILMGLYAERRYQVDVMFLVALGVSVFSYIRAGDISSKTIELSIAVFVILTLCYIVARFEMHLSRVAENQLKARRMLNHQLEEIHVADSLALAKMLQQFEEVNHDLRNPLTVAVNTMNALRSSELSEEQSEQLVLLQKSVSTVLSIAEKSLQRDYASAGPREPIQWVQLSTVLEQVAGQYRQIAEANGTVIETYVGSDLPSIGVPLTDLTRIMNNLVHNAIKYTSHGRVEVFAFLKNPPGQGGESMLLITVKDSGRGMTPSRLIEVRNGTNGPDEGESSSRGIGLRSCRDLLKALGGQIQIESGEGTGTSVAVAIPVLRVR